jgi:hypothetical protein
MRLPNFQVRTACIPVRHTNASDHLATANNFQGHLVSSFAEHSHPYVLPDLSQLLSHSYTHLLGSACFFDQTVHAINMFFLFVAVLNDVHRRHCHLRFDRDVKTLVAGTHAWSQINE